MKKSKDGENKGRLPAAAVLAGVKENVTPALGRVRGFLGEKEDVIRTFVFPAAYALLFSTRRIGTVVLPFGLSAICAADEGLPAAVVLAALLLASIGGGDFLYTAAAYALCGAIVIGAKYLRRTLSPAVRSGLAAAVGTALTFALSLRGGVVLYELCLTALSAAVFPALTLALRGVFSEEKEAVPGIGACAVVYTAALSLASLGGIFPSLGVILSMAASLYTSYAYGTHRGIAMGVACGLAADASAGLVYAVAAATSGILMNVSPMAAVSAGTVLATAVGVAGGGANVLGGMFPEFMLCTAVAGPLFQYGIIPVPGVRTDTNAPADDGIDAMKVQAAKKRTSALSSAFSSVSSLMRKVSGVVSRPTVFELRQVCDEAFDAYCAGCSHKDVCWGDEYDSTASALAGTVRTIREGRRVSAACFTPSVRGRCEHVDGIIAKINVGAAACARAKTLCGTYADGLGTVSKLLEDTEDETEFAPDPALSAKLAKRLAAAGLRAESLTVYGKRRRRVLARGVTCRAGNDDVRRAAEEVLASKLAPPEYLVGAGGVTMSMTSVPEYAVHAGKCFSSRVEGRCGDTVSFFGSDGGYFYAMLSDGMGSGADAALASGTAVSFLERMLGAGCTVQSVLPMLNDILLGGNTECFATLDVLELDLLTGDARLIKSGAAPSFVLRDGRLYRLASSTLPVGIVKSEEAEKLSFEVCGGDYIVLLSDGVVRDERDESWLYSLLCGTDTSPSVFDGKSPDEAARAVCAAAEERFGKADDVSVCIVKVEEK